MFLMEKESEQKSNAETRPLLLKLFYWIWGDPGSTLLPNPMEELEYG